jgi:hypothetical protein
MPPKQKPVSIVSQPPAAITAATPERQTPYWRPEDFNELIFSQGYEAYLDKALRCPCVDKSTGQALSTCYNCLGRGWFFVDRRETRVISQHMDNKKRYQNWGEINKGIANITARAIDKLGFMDRIIMLDLEAYYSEVLYPKQKDDVIYAYPVYEPLYITNAFVFSSETEPLEPIPNDLYKIVDNRIIFDESLSEYFISSDLNQSKGIMSVTMRYAYHPVYHVIDPNRELMKVRAKTCQFTDKQLTAMPINVMCKKAHYIFDAQRVGDVLYDNTQYD